MDDKRETIREIVTAVLKVLAGFGVPGAGVAQKAVEETARALEKRETQRRLADALRQAEEDFRATARERGWEDVADAVLQLPMHDLPSFRKALRAALKRGKGAAVPRALEEFLASLPLPPARRAAAARLYAECLWGQLWSVPDFRDGVRDMLFQEQREQLKRIEASLDELVRRPRQEAWKALKPAVLEPVAEPTPENLLESLKAPYRLVPFRGRAHEALQDEIVRALRDLPPNDTRAWVLWGPGGVGKTRTAVEVGHELGKLGWQAFFLPERSATPKWDDHLPAWSCPDRPTLLIVDYAGERPEKELRLLVGAIRDGARSRRCPLALLLLLRADPHDAAAGYVAEALREAVRYEVRPVPLAKEPEDRQAIFCAARAVFRERLAPAEAGPEVDYPPEALPRTALALLALAVLAAHGHQVAASRDEVAVLTDLWANWEQKRWQRVLEAHGGAGLLETPEVWREARERIEQALVAASLGRPFTAPEEVAAWWAAHFPFRAQTATGQRLAPEWLARRLTALFPAMEEGGWRLPPIVPDPLADVVLARHGAGLETLAKASLPAPEAVEQALKTVRQLAEGAGGPMVIDGSRQPELLAPLWPIHLVAGVLPRLSGAAVAGAGEAAEAALGAVAGWLEAVARALPSEVASGWLSSWWSTLPSPDRTLLLRGFLEQVARLWREAAEDEKERARALLGHGYALSALGRREEALTATREAVEIYRNLAQANPQA